MKELISAVLENQSTVDNWRDDFRSDEYTQASQLNFNIFGMHLNQRRGCQCVNDLYRHLSSKNKIKNIMNKENAQFVLKDVVITLHGLGKILGSSSTEEELKDLLRRFPNQIDKFEKVPSNWEEIVNGEDEAIQEAAKTKMKIIEFPEGTQMFSSKSYDETKLEFEALDITEEVLTDSLEGGRVDSIEEVLVDFILKAEATAEINAES